MPSSSIISTPSPSKSNTNNNRRITLKKLLFHNGSNNNKSSICSSNSRSYNDTDDILTGDEEYVPEHEEVAAILSHTDSVSIDTRSVTSNELFTNTNNNTTKAKRRKSRSKSRTRKQNNRQQLIPPSSSSALSNVESNNSNSNISWKPSFDNYNNNDSNNNNNKDNTNKPPKKLEPYSKDSRKKDRPIGVTIRKQLKGKMDAPAPTANNNKNNNNNNNNNNDACNISINSSINSDDDNHRNYHNKDTTSPVASASSPSSNNNLNLIVQNNTSQTTPLYSQHISPISSSTFDNNNNKNDNKQDYSMEKTPPRRTISKNNNNNNNNSNKTTSPSTSNYSSKKSRSSTSSIKEAHDEINTVKNNNHTKGKSLERSTYTSDDNIINNNNNNNINNATKDKSNNNNNNDKTKISIKKRLSRPFERPNPLPWVIEVGSAEWDNEQARWKYRILIQRRDITQNSFTKSFSFRSLTDFQWLEKSLTNEFNGALLIPLFTIAIGQYATVAETPVEADKLKLWLSDVLNGIRGAGEWNITYPEDLIMIKSESMESFMYRNVMGATLEETIPIIEETTKEVIETKSSNKNNKTTTTTNGCGIIEKSSLLGTILAPIESCVAPDCGGNEISRNVVNDDYEAEITTTNSFINSDNENTSTTNNKEQFILAASDLAIQYRLSSLKCMERLQTLYDYEERLGTAWKRFANSLIVLFDYEKDMEINSKSSYNIGHINKDNIPYRKITRENLSIHINELSKCKVERAIPSLTIVQSMLNSYVADLSAIPPSVQAYVKAPNYSTFDCNNNDSINNSIHHDGDDTSVSSMSSSNGNHNSNNISRWDEWKDWSIHTMKGKLSNNNNNNAEDLRRTHSKQLSYALHQEQAKKRYKDNEQMLRKSLGIMFRTNPFRLARIAWRYWNTEAIQCSTLNTAAVNIKIMLDKYISQSNVTKMLKRHSREEKADCIAELDLIQKIVNLGGYKKYPNANNKKGTESDSSVSTTSINNELVEFSNDDININKTMEIKRDKALEIARHRLGRWDAALAMSIMDAVGVDDPNVKVEETTRELRQVRKFAIGLRENLNKCIDCIKHIQNVITTATTNNNTNTKYDNNNKEKSTQTENKLMKCRQNFMYDICIVLSGILSDNDKKDNLPRKLESSKAILHNAGIDTNDPMGWLPTPNKQKSKRSEQQQQPFSIVCLGDLAEQYIDKRDAHIEWLLSSILGLLNDYYQRVEAIEGFVFMECVGIQLEKHFNNKRSNALAAFEKKTDITSAMNVARKKRMGKLAVELEERLKRIGPEVNHTTVKETKEAHLESKNLKNELHELSMRRLTRAREASTERIVTIIELWCKEEQINAEEEIKALGQSMALLERLLCKEN